MVVQMKWMENNHAFLARLFLPRLQPSSPDAEMNFISDRRLTQTSPSTSRHENRGEWVLQPAARPGDSARRGGMRSQRCSLHHPPRQFLSRTRSLSGAFLGLLLSWTAQT